MRTFRGIPSLQYRFKHFPSTLSARSQGLTPCDVTPPSGVLLSIFLTSIGRAYAQTGAWPKALESGIASLQTYGGAAVGDRTMIDALVPANKALLAGEGLPRAAEMARAGAEATAKMDRAGAGRSSYLSARSLTDVPDPGAVAVAEVFAALAAVH